MNSCIKRTDISKSLDLNIKNSYLE